MWEDQVIIIIFTILWQLIQTHHTHTSIPITCLIFMLELVRSLPYFTEADGHMKAVEDSQWHWYVGDDGPGPDSIQVELCWMLGVYSWCLRGVDRPRSKIEHPQGNLKVKLKLTTYTVWLWLSTKLKCDWRRIKVFNLFQARGVVKEILSL